MIVRPPSSPLFPYATLFLPPLLRRAVILSRRRRICGCFLSIHSIQRMRSEEHTSELQSLRHLGCRLLFSNDRATTELSPLSLRDALPTSATPTRCHPEPQAKDLRLFLIDPFDPTHGDNRQALSRTNRGLSPSRPGS